MGIPQEIEKEILLRIPVKSILRFKSTCKSWYRLICSPEFVKDHLIVANKNPKLMISHSCFYSLDYDAILSASKSSLFNCDGVILMDDPVKELKGVTFRKVLGSCNGLLCLGTFGNNPLILWNPSTREYKVIIPPDDHWLLSYGFGYDSENNDYKLVCIDTIYFYVFTLKSGSWRKVVNTTFPCVNLGESVGLLLNGALHFTQTTESLGKISKAIVAFDISSEKFMKFPFTEEFILRQSDSTFNLRVLGDSLCLLVCGFPTRRVDAWVMQNYGLTESWTKKFTTTEERITTYSHVLNFYRYFINADVILIMVGCHFGLYDQKKDRVRYMAINGIEDFYSYLETYVESLVSLSSATYMQENYKPRRR